MTKLFQLQGVHIDPEVIKAAKDEVFETILAVCESGQGMRWARENAQAEKMRGQELPE